MRDLFTENNNDDYRSLGKISSKIEHISNLQKLIKIPPEYPIDQNHELMKYILREKELKLVSSNENLGTQVFSCLDFAK
jgi:hypothetical protein